MSEKLYDAYEMAKNMSLDEAYNYCLKLEYEEKIIAIHNYYIQKTNNQEKP